MIMIFETSKRRVTFLSLIFLVKIELTEDILHSIPAHCVTGLIGCERNATGYPLDYLRTVVR